MTKDRLRRLTVAALALLAAALASLSTAQAWTQTVLHSFCSKADCEDGTQPVAGLVQDAAGNLYGTASFGGTHDEGVVFALMQNGGRWTYKVLHNFCGKTGCADGRDPAARLIVDAAGNLYGTALSGGAANCGVVFRLSPDSERKRWTLQVLHAFCAVADDGKFPLAGLTYAGAAAGAPYDGKSPLYGTTSQGGANGGGAVYALALNEAGKWKESILYSFCVSADCSDGWEPLGDLLLDSAGNLYGNTSMGGSSNQGAVFRLSRNARGTKWKESVLYNFCQLSGCTDGARPLGHLLIDANGALFGTTTEPGDQGVVYRLARSGGQWQETVLYLFCQEQSCTDGYTPMAGLIMDSAGTLFGTSAFGGTNPVGAGTVFTLSSRHHREHTILYNFCSAGDCSDGAFPEAPLIMDATGRLFGTTAGGVGSTRGTVFMLSP